MTRRNNATPALAGDGGRGLARLGNEQQQSTTSPQQPIADSRLGGMRPVTREQLEAYCAKYPPAAPAEPTGRVLLDYEGLSAFLGVKVPTLRSMVSRRVIPCLRLGPRIVRFDRAEIERWLESRRIAPGGGL